MEEKKIPEKITSELVEKLHESMPDRIKEYLNNRGITDEIINTNSIGYITNVYNKNWIVIPIKGKRRNYLFCKLRRDPESKGYEAKYLVFPKGNIAQLYGLDSLKGENDYIVICEGEFDQLLLKSKGINAITNTNGVGTFKNSWVPLFRKFKKVYICFDKDKPGQEGALSVAQKLAKDGYCEIYIITLPDELPTGGDLTDYFTKHNGTTDDLLSKYAEKYELSDEVELGETDNVKEERKRITDVPVIDEEIVFEDWEKEIKLNFPEMAFPAEIIISVLAQILILDVVNPFAIVLVDVPSSGKTICLNFFSDIHEITYTSDKFTPAAFVSNAATVATEDLDEIDLLPRIKYKLFIVRELATIFSKREDDLNELLGILTRVLDGEGLSTDSGVHGQRGYEGDYLFMMAAASTPIPSRVFKMMGNLGSRLFFLNMNSKDKTEEQLAMQLIKGSFKVREAACKEITKEFIYSLWRKYPEGINWDNISENVEYLKLIAKCAHFLARLRAVIHKLSEETKNTKGIKRAIKEHSDRINQLFYNLCRGHALIQGRTHITEADLKLPIEIALDSASDNRSLLIKKLIECGGVMSTIQIEEAFHHSKTWALEAMDDFIVLGLCTEYMSKETGLKMIELVDEFKWFVGDECKKIRGIN